MGIVNSNRHTHLSRVKASTLGKLFLNLMIIPNILNMRNFTPIVSVSTPRNPTIPCTLHRHNNLMNNGHRLLHQNIPSHTFQHILHLRSHTYNFQPGLRILRHRRRQQQLKNILRLNISRLSHTTFLFRTVLRIRHTLRYRHTPHPPLLHIT